MPTSGSKKPSTLIVAISLLLSDILTFVRLYKTTNASIPADIIKFDRVFASRSLKNNKGRQVIKSLIKMLKMVEYELVFEGVETKEELDTVVSYGCDVIQGFYFDRPLPANEFVDKYYTGSREITYGT